MVTDKPIGKRLLGRPAHRREDKVRMDIKEIDIHPNIVLPSKPRLF
jgi:hypothetical protein